MDVWRERQSNVTERCALLERRTRDLKTRKARLDEVFIDEKAINRETYEDQLARLNEQIAVMQLELHDALLEELEIESNVAPQAA